MGAPPHGGFAMGIERFVALLAGEPNIREMIAFPKVASGSDPLTGAPTTIPERIARRARNPDVAAELSPLARSGRWRGHTCRAVVRGRRRRAESTRCPHERTRSVAPRRADRAAAAQDLPRRRDGGYERDRVREAFDAFRRHVAPAAGPAARAAGRRQASTGRADRPRRADGLAAPDPRRRRVRGHDRARRPGGVRERSSRAPSKRCAASRVDLAAARGARSSASAQETERQRVEIVNAARNEARELLTKPNRDAAQELREAEARAPGCSSSRATRRPS